jgi:hypothetical protein
MVVQEACSGGHVSLLHYLQLEKVDCFVYNKLSSSVCWALWCLENGFGCLCL